MESRSFQKSALAVAVVAAMSVPVAHAAPVDVTTTGAGTASVYTVADIDTQQASTSAPKSHKQLEVSVVSY